MIKEKKKVVLASEWDKSLDGAGWICSGLLWYFLRITESKNLSGKRPTLPPEREPETQFNLIFYLAVFIFIIFDSLAIHTGYSFPLQFLQIFSCGPVAIYVVGNIKFTIFLFLFLPLKPLDIVARCRGGDVEQLSMINIFYPKRRAVHIYYFSHGNDAIYVCLDRIFLYEYICELSKIACYKNWISALEYSISSIWPTWARKVSSASQKA